MNVTKDDTDFDYCSQQLSARHEKNQYILSVLVKKTYSISNKGACIFAADKLSLQQDCVYYADNDKLLQHDSDLYPLKNFTDVIIKGTARNKQSVGKFLVQAQVGRYLTEIMVVGNRKAYLSHSNKIEFTAPEIIKEVPLRYDYAYGGVDVEAEKKIILPDPEIVKQLPPGLDLLAKSLFRYQRNPAGKGFIVQKNPASFENLELPNLEDPGDLLTPENLLTGDENRWHEMPVPRCTDWVDHGFFPRFAYLGVAKVFEHPPHRLKEIINKWADEGLLNNTRSLLPLNMRFANGASLGLQLPYLFPGEAVRLINMHPQMSDLKFHLPLEYPKIWVDGRKGKLLETRPVIHSVVIEPDENKVSILWRGSGPALRPYHDEELKTMPYKVEWRDK